MAAGKKKLVIVESPNKAKKIGGYLGRDYIVRASVGHVRDLPRNASEVPAAIKKEPWSNIAVNVEDDFTPVYIVPQEKRKIVKELKEALKQADELILATDEDREGESIGWHVVEILKPKVPISRMTFSEITKTAIQRALENRRELDHDLIQAQEARRVLDRLYGYTLSPLLWKKIAGGKSAGRVQSVAVRILVQRELERLAFRSGTYWDLESEVAKLTGEKSDVPFSATLQTVGGRKIATGKDFDEATGRLKEGSDVLLVEEKQARELVERLKTVEWKVAEINERTETRTPYPPFITSTLQRDASNRLGISPRQTMGIAQQLYEGGFITYMRTDSVSLSKEATDAARQAVLERYGDSYLSERPRTYQNKTKNAQEAHEAIRPAGTEMRTASELGLSGQQARLYDLIWKRTVASQMSNATLRFHSVTLTAADTEFRATGKSTDFAGFFRAYVEGRDNPEEAIEERDTPLPPLKEGEQLNCRDLTANPHETKPPARFTEASLVKALEDDGIGRPSTYSSIIETIQSRGYARKQGKTLIPTFSAVGVTRLLEKNFPDLVDVAFTARMEQTLDDIAAGQADRTGYLHQFYSGDRGLDGQVQSKIESIDRKEACTLELEGIGSRVCLGSYGPYVEQESEDGQRLTASLPEDIAPADLSNDQIDELIRKKQEGPQMLGIHPEEQAPVYLMDGPYGPYVQLGDADVSEKKPKRVSLPKSHPVEDIDFEAAVELLSLPRRIGHHPETGKVVNAGVGRYGPYVLHDKKYASFDKKSHTARNPNGNEETVLTVSMETAVEMLKAAANRGSSALKELGEHPDDGKTVAVFEGKYGPYVKCGRVNATLPKDLSVDEITLDRAVELINEKAAKKGTKKKRKSTAKKSTKKKTAKKKSPGKKSTRKKSAKKKG